MDIAEKGLCVTFNVIVNGCPHKNVIISDYQQSSAHRNVVYHYRYYLVLFVIR